jgi:hypothetical protein
MGEPKYPVSGVKVASRFGKVEDFEGIEVGVFGGSFVLRFGVVVGEKWLEVGGVEFSRRLLVRCNSTGLIYVVSRSLVECEWLTDEKTWRRPPNGWCLEGACVWVGFGGYATGDVRGFIYSDVMIEAEYETGVEAMKEIERVNDLMAQGIFTQQ